MPFITSPRNRNLLALILLSKLLKLTLATAPPPNLCHSPTNTKTDPNPPPGPPQRINTAGIIVLAIWVPLLGIMLIGIAWYVCIHDWLRARPEMKKIRREAEAARRAEAERKWKAEKEVMEWWDNILGMKTKLKGDAEGLGTAVDVDIV